MKGVTAFCLFVVLLSGLALALAGGTAGPDEAFPIYDNMYYKGKPDTTRTGLIASNIVYENKIWPNKQDVGTLPDRVAYESLVRKLSANPGPLVIDVESLPLKGSAGTARHNMEVLAKLADWARAAVPGKVIGYYGTNTLSKVPPANLALAKELAAHVDVFFPPMYTFDDHSAAWGMRAEETAAEAHSLDARKPVYFYLWPQYHDGTPKAFQYVSATYWQTQLITSHRCANGIVLWSPSRYEWDDHTGWWASTVEFARNIKPGPDPIPR